MKVGRNVSITLEEGRFFDLMIHFPNGMFGVTLDVYSRGHVVFSINWWRMRYPSYIYSLMNIIGPRIRHFRIRRD